MVPHFSKQLQKWYSRNARALPWRGNKDPYSIWVSEIMLQQTRVETVGPYFQRWMERFPNLDRLAAATEQDVLRLWEGMGYYSRARNLHRAARIIKDKFAGQIPTDPALLKQLPGIGGYTAAAIASIAFGADIPALDANGERVLARCFTVDLPIRSPAGKRELDRITRRLLPHGKAGDFNQALMDLGARICTSRRPSCSVCPMRSICRAYAKGLQENLPVKPERTALPHHIVTAAVIRRGDRYLIARRPSTGLLGGLWEFPGGKQEAGESLAACLQREIREELGATIQVGKELGIFQHTYSHFRITLHAFACRLTGSEPEAQQVTELRWVSAARLMTFPMGKVDRQISKLIAAGGRKNQT
jgi:A/G-specific adenine glycosylase